MLKFQKPKTVSWLSVLLILMLLFTNVLYADLQHILDTELPFDDVPLDAWYRADLKTAYNAKLIQGKTDRLFAPEDNLTAAETVKLAVCMHKLKKGETPEFPTGVSPWYQPYVDYAKAEGILSVDLPWNEDITRGEYMSVFSKLIGDEELRLNEVKDGSIPDVPMTHPFAVDIYKLYRVGVVQGTGEQRLCNPGSYIKRNEVATILTRLMFEGKRLVFDAKDLLIRFHPVDQEYSVVGYRVPLDVTVVGGRAPLSYRWEFRPKGGTDFEPSLEEGYMTNILLVPVAQKPFEYRCVIRDADGKEVISRIATVQLFAPLSITKQPKNEAGPIGSTVKLSVEISGAKEPVTYQWEYSEDRNGPYYKSKAIGNNTKELTVPIESKPYYYRCYIKDRDEKSVHTIAVIVAPH